MKLRLAVAAAVAALTISAVAASGASAAGFSLIQGLQLTESGQPLHDGATVYDDQLIVGQCLVESTGRLFNNGDPIDVITAQTPTNVYCEGGSTATGGLSYVALADNGQALAYTAPAIKLTTAAKCTYEFSLLSGSFPVGGEYGMAYITGSATGDRSRESSPSCARTLSTQFDLAEIGPNSDAPLGTGLVSGPRF